MSSWLSALRMSKSEGGKLSAAELRAPIIATTIAPNATIITRRARDMLLFFDHQGSRAMAVDRCRLRNWVEAGALLGGEIRETILPYDKEGVRIWFMALETFHRTDLAG